MALKFVGPDDPILKEKIPEWQGEPSLPELRKIAFEMFDRMMAGVLMSSGQIRGLGLAAPQVGLRVRMYVQREAQRMRYADAKVCINPKIVWASGELVPSVEGCLSYPDRRVEVQRHKRIRVEFIDLGGNTRTGWLEDLNAFVAQHEIEHLDGMCKVSPDYRPLLTNDAVPDAVAEAPAGGTS